MKRILFIVFTALLVFSAAPQCTAQSKAQGKAKSAAPNKDQVDVASLHAVEITDDITPPRLTEVASPDYTPEAKKKKIEGTVTLAIVIDKKGDVADAKVIKGLGYGLDENAIIAVKEWKYKPAEKDGEAIAVKLEVTTDFYLRD
jgi:TonB family protein